MEYQPKHSKFKRRIKLLLFIVSTIISIIYITTCLLNFKYWIILSPEVDNIKIVKKIKYEYYLKHSEEDIEFINSKYIVTTKVLEYFKPQ